MVYPKGIGEKIEISYLEEELPKYLMSKIGLDAQF